jgi:Ca2+-binding RTX toxin-like protein
MTHPHRVLVLALFAAAVLPASASAATVSKTGSTVSYIADPGEANDVTISLGGGNYTIAEQGSGVTVTNGGGCTVSGQTATCPSSGTELLDVQAGDRSDTVTIQAPTPSHISGGDGFDTLRGGSGADVISGGAGTDVADYSDRRNPLTITVDGKPGDGEKGENDNVQTDVEIVNGGAGNDTITGSDADNVLNGNGGKDTLNGAGGSDALNRGDGDGNQDAGAGGDVLHGGPGDDSVSYEEAKSSVRVTIDGIAGDGAAGENDNVMRDVENVTGSRFADVLIGNSGPNVLQGGPGNDRLNGGGGADTLDGGSGDDALQALGGGMDALLCEGGTDGVIADARDVLNNCEIVERTLVQVLVATTKAKRGVVRIPLRCSAYSTDGCKGTLTLKVGKRTLGTKAFGRPHGAKATIKVKLSNNGRQLLRKKRALSATAALSMKDASGQVTRMSRKVRLTA